MSVPNRAEHPNRKVAPATHYVVSHSRWGGTLSTSAGGKIVAPNTREDKYFSDKKSAKTYGKSLAKQGYEVSAEKHSPESQQAGYTQGKPAKLMEAGFTAAKFLKGY